MEAELVSLDGGTTWRRPEFASDERERVTKRAKAYRYLHRARYDEFSRDVNHEEGDEMMSHRGEPLDWQEITRGGTSSVMPSKYERNRQGLVVHEVYSTLLPASNVNLQSNTIHIGGDLCKVPSERNQMKLNETNEVPATETEAPVTTEQGAPAETGEQSSVPLTPEQIEGTVTEFQDGIRSGLTSHIQGLFAAQCGDQSTWSEDLSTQVTSEIALAIDNFGTVYRSYLESKIEAAA